MPLRRNEGGNGGRNLRPRDRIQFCTTEGSPMLRTSSPYVYHPLSSEDRMFLSCERPDLHMHLGATLVFDAARALRREGGGLDAERVMRYVESRLHLVPRYRQRLQHAALSGEPVWIDDDRFDARYHLRHVTAAAPGDEEALKRLASHAISQPLDRSRPLWRLWVVTGLERDRFAIISMI